MLFGLVGLVWLRSLLLVLGLSVSVVCLLLRLFGLVNLLVSAIQLSVSSSWMFLFVGLLEVLCMSQILAL